MNLPPSVPPRFGVSSSSRFAVVAGTWRRLNRRASLGKTHHLPISRPASCQVSAPDIRPRLITSARPLPQHHLAGWLFATYTGSASCFLPTSRFWRCPCLVGVVLPSGHGGPSCSQLSPGTAACASCQAHVNNPAQRAGLFKKFQTTLSSNILRQGFVRYPLEPLASDISEFRPDDVSSHKPHESFAKATGARAFTIWTGRRGL